VSSYVRPVIDVPVFRDADGQVIDYGNRWPGSPPDDTYSVDTHPERFAPLHTVADAIVAHLRETYDVEIDEGADVAGDVIRQAGDVARAVRIRPNDPTCAALTIVFTAYPGIVIHAGELHEFFFPTCGCDACDSHWEAEAGDLELHVFAAVNGYYSESIESGPDPWMEYAIALPDGSGRSGRGQPDGVSAERLESARALLPAEGWAAWPRAADA
jgi:hypothetical protein